MSIRGFYFFLILVLVAAAFVAVSSLPAAAAPVSQSATQLLANPDFASDVAMWEPSYSDDCGEYPVWLDQSFFPDDSYFGLAIPDENCSGLSNGVSQSFYVSGYVGSTYVLAVSGYSYCSRTIEVYLDDLVSGQTAFHSGSGFHAPSITGVITDDSAPWSVTVQWNNSCSFPDETWLDSIHFTAYASTPTPTETPTNTPEPTETSTPTETPTNTPEPFPTVTPTPTPSPGGGGTTVFFPLLRCFGCASGDSPSRNGATVIHDVSSGLRRFASVLR